MVFAADDGHPSTGHERDPDIEKLRSLNDELRQAKNVAQRDRDLLRKIADTLPVRLTLEGEDGRVLLANHAATGKGHAPSAIEEQSAGPDGIRTLLTWKNPLPVDGATLLLSTSVDITERKEIERQLTRLAYLDDLTGLANRTFIEQHIEDIIRRGANADRFALAFIDLDNFKHINDYYSHAVGDALLAKAAQRMSSLLGGSDMIARISGDEFLLVVEPVESESDLHAVIGKILEELKQPFYIEGFEVLTSASIGVSLFPDHGRSYDRLRRHADHAMYRAKTGEKGRAIFFDAEMSRTLTARMELEQRLRLAIRDGRICCAYQPKVDIRSQEVVGFETLIRWRDDQGIISPPGAFVGLATELGLMDAITLTVLGEAAKAIDQLDLIFGSGTTISINVAARQAGELHFMRSLTDALKATPHAGRFMLELTEDALVAGSRFQDDILPILRELGVKVSIDDFGTGYSSLSGLADITADEIKIDRSFITAIHARPRNQSILRAIESLGHALGMTVVAEGIETFEELAYLQAATRIRYGQGFYFARPFFLEDFARSRNQIFEGRSDDTARARTQGREASLVRSRRADNEERG